MLALAIEMMLLLAAFSTRSIARYIQWCDFLSPSRLPPLLLLLSALALVHIIKLRNLFMWKMRLTYRAVVSQLSLFVRGSCRRRWMSERESMRIRWVARLHYISTSSPVKICRHKHSDEHEGRVWKIKFSFSYVCCSGAAEMAEKAEESPGFVILIVGSFLYGNF